MRLSILLMTTCCMLTLSSCAQSVPNREAQIGAAVKAAPEDQRAGATVLGYDAKGNIITLREGNNNTICLADNPMQVGYSCSCYHKDLEPFMARGRQLRAEGKDGTEIFEIREAEARAGTLKMPEQPTTLHVLSGADGEYDMEADTVRNAHYRYVVYIPFATAESTGLPLKPIVPGGPWLMDPGTHRAHIMIDPPLVE